MIREMIIFGENNTMSRQMVEFDDAVLTTLQVAPELLQIVQGYKNGQQVAPFLFKPAPVTKEAGIFPAFGQDAWNLADAERQLRGQVQHVDAAVGNVTFKLTEAALGWMLDQRELDNYAMGAEELSTIRTNMVNRQLSVKNEYDAAYQATLVSNYSGNTNIAKNGASLDWVNSGKPVSDILNEKENVRDQVGVYPNTAIFDPYAWRLFRTNEDVRSYISKFTAPGPEPVIVNEQIAAAILEVDEVKVGKMVNKNAIGTVTDIWSVNQTGNVVLAYTGTGLEEPTYGLNFIHKEYPKATGYFSQPHKSTVYDIQNLYQFKVTLAAAGQLIYGIK